MNLVNRYRWKTLPNQFCVKRKGEEAPYVYYKVEGTQLWVRWWDRDNWLMSQYTPEQMFNFLTEDAYFVRSNISEENEVFSI
jgi:hypothetical protein